MLHLQINEKRQFPQPVCPGVFTDGIPPGAKKYMGPPCCDRVGEFHLAPKAALDGMTAGTGGLSVSVPVPHPGVTVPANRVGEQVQGALPSYFVCPSCNLKFAKLGKNGLCALCTQHEGAASGAAAQGGKYARQDIAETKEREGEK